MTLLFTRMYFFDNLSNESMPGIANLKILIKEISYSFSVLVATSGNVTARVGR